ncbi:DUF742 domain-containing protein [Allosaccharopolyspora coralli]|uniref:DUF742 domain-containing protein n=1 Tax=Allosaccharopolyspora coralli TaxID=2665642 RepID=A0A5Q3QA13_9PSEU|nr:DUF742 domain-containing protein [Allosaccharopolyspora coralli]QGK71213.1 DUF742 domain-containing protein [Allosaccharopolyspora coralli]
MSTPLPGAQDDNRDDEIANILGNFTLGAGSRVRAAQAADRSAEAANRGDTQHEYPSSAHWSEPEFSSAVEAHTEEEPATAIRPYAWTGGRTRTKHILEVETLVSTSAVAASPGAGRLEHESVAELCREPRSVAEVGALLGVPIGVVKVLLGDMADLGLVSVHDTVSDNGSESHLFLMERVLSGLRRL